MEQFRKTILPQGITVVSESIPHAKSFSLGFWFNVGSRDETPEDNGITHFIEHMLFKGTRKRSPRRIANDIESYGGYLNAFTSKEHTCYYGRGLSQHIERTFDVLADMAQDPAFKDSEIKKEAGVVIDELNDIEDSPEELIFDKFEEIIFAGNSLALPIIGSEENIRKFSRPDLVKFIEGKYGFNRFYIAASGNVDHNKLIALSEKYISKNFGKKKIVRTDVVPSKICNSVIEKETQQVYSIIGRAVEGYKDKKRSAINVLSHLLGEGSSSRLFQQVRERNGICYQLNSFLNSFYDISAFGVFYSTNDKLFDKSKTLISNEFKKLREKKVTERELKRAKEYLKGSMILSLEGLTNRMFRMAQSEIYFGKIIPVEETIAEIDEVTPEQIWDLSNELLDEKTLSEIVIQSKKSKVKTT